MRISPTGLIILLALASCEAPKPAIVAEPASPPAPTDPVYPAPPSVAAGWHFSADAGCSASITSPSVNVDLAATGSRLMVIAHLPPDVPPPKRAYVPIAFAGSSGNWNMIGGKRDGEIVASGATTNLTSLLDGGVIKIGHTDDGLPTLHVPNAGPAGQAWSKCAGAS